MQQYQEPSGTLTPASAQSLILALQGDLQKFIELGPVIHEVLKALGGFSVDEEQTEQGLTVRKQAITGEAGGWGVLFRRCPGWLGQEERGEIKLTALFTGKGLGEVVWGSIEACRVESDIQRYFDGEIRLGLIDLEQGELLIDFDGEFGGPDFGEPLQVDFLLRGGYLFVRQSVEEGEFLLGLKLEEISDTGNFPFLLRDQGGEWSCHIDLNGGRCDTPEKSIVWP